MKKITVFSTTTCAYCPMVKEWLKNKGLAYEEVVLDQDPSRQQEVLQKSGSLSVPVTIVEQDNGMEQVVIGFNPGQLAAATAA